MAKGKWTLDKKDLAPPRGAKKLGPDDSGLTIHTLKGRPVRWEWEVGSMGVRGTDYHDAEVSEGNHRGHVMSVLEGAQDTELADSTLNIVEQSPTVNLSNVKRFERWRSENAQGNKVIVVQPVENGPMTVFVDSDPPVKTTFDPLSTERFPDDWFQDPGPWPK